MQLLFGVIGPRPQSASVFDSLLELTIESNPGIHPEVESAPDLSMGRHVRSWGRWDDPTSDLTLLLDGEIRLIDGVETLTHGASTTELATVAALYRRVGSAIWDRLDGSFCLVIRDGRSTRIGLDVGGTRAVYWWAAAGIVAFHSQLLDLAPTYPDDLRVDEAGIATFLSDAIYPMGATAFEGIQLVGAGQVLEVETSPDGSRAAASSYFRFSPMSGSSARSVDVLTDELNDLLGSAIAKSWRAARRPVVPLSGGVDSRYLAAMAAHVTGDPAQVQTITWGEEPTRPNSDAVIAHQVAAALGVPNLWCEKQQVHRVDTVERALYLTSGEGDGVLNYPSEHEIHERFVEDHGWQSLFRGDQVFGEAHHLLTRRAILPAASLTRIGRDPAYAHLVGMDQFRSMSERQDELYGRWHAGITAESAHGQLCELGYETEFRRELAPYNTLKNAHFEVYTPYLERQVLDWIRRLPETHRSGKRLLRAALDRRFPQLSNIPFASRSNMPDWEMRATTDPALARSFRELCDQPGWLDTIGAKDQVIEALEGLESEARASAARAPVPAGPSNPPARANPQARARLSQILRDGARSTLPGKLVREWTMERRAVRSRSMYDRLSRLVVVHVLVGKAQARHARRRAETA